jgi:single-stranded-DNA-specific exonuclease
MQTSWSILPAAQPSAELVAAVGGHPLVAQLLAQRGHTDPEGACAFLDPSRYLPAPPTALAGLEVAAKLLYEAVVQQKRILVWGDFDVDGQTATSLLVAALRGLSGDQQVHFHVPNRFREGHGIRLEKLKVVLAERSSRPDLLLTCDTGIGDGEAIDFAKDQGVQVIVTDHHDLPDELQGLEWPFGEAASQAGQEVGRCHLWRGVRRADAVVNPKFQPQGDPLRSLPGVGVAFKLIQQLYLLCGRNGDESDLLDLVALGIVADVAEQVHDARYLLQLGLERLRTTHRTGLLALMEVARLTPAMVDADAIGFQLGPRMNALGRLDDATVAVELLTTHDAIRAGQLAARMERLNQQRRLLTSQITAVAMEMIDRQPSLLDFNALVLAHPAWHAGIVGIVASRLAEEFHRPAVLLITPPGEAARGSARSVPGVDIGAAIAGCSHLLLTHGGHPGAAGISLLPENIERFRRELHRQIELNRAADPPPGLTVDAVLPWESVDMHLVDQIRRLAPFGNGNPAPQFMTSNLTVVEDRRLGRDGEHRQLRLRSESGAVLPVLWFKGADLELPPAPLDLVYTAGIHDYRGERSLQLTFVASRHCADEPVVAGAVATVRIYDMRRTATLDGVPAPGQATWYAEGVRISAIPPAARRATGEPVETSSHLVAYAPRRQFDHSEKGRPLVVYSVPPSPDLLHWLCNTLRPDEIFLLGRVTTEDSMDVVARQVAGMCKYALQRDGTLRIDRMAARLGTTEAVIRYSLLWLESRGQIAIADWQAGNVAYITRNGVEVHPDAAALIQAQLEEQLAEVRAYRRYFLRASVSELGLPTGY